MLVSFVYKASEGKVKKMMNYKKTLGSRKTRAIVIVVVFLATILLLAYFLFFRVYACSDNACFVEKMKACSKARFINEETDASWLYDIKGSTGTKCEIDVKLLNAKKGEFELENLIGYKMQCSYPVGKFAYPEKELENCHGRLKEEFQAVTIKRLHTLILENIGKIGEGIAEVL